MSKHVCVQVYEPQSELSILVKARQQMLFRLFPQPNQGFFREYENGHINWELHIYVYIKSQIYSARLLYDSFN